MKNIWPIIRKTTATGKTTATLSGVNVPVAKSKITEMKLARILMNAALFFIFQNREATITGEMQRIIAAIPKSIVSICETKIATIIEAIATSPRDILIIEAIFLSTILFFL